MRTLRWGGLFVGLAWAIASGLSAEPYRELRRWTVRLTRGPDGRPVEVPPPGGFPPLPPGARRSRWSNLIAHGEPLLGAFTIVVDHYGDAPPPGLPPGSRPSTQATTAPTWLPPNLPIPPTPRLPDWPDDDRQRDRDEDDDHETGDLEDCEDPSRDPHDRDRDRGERRHGDAWRERRDEPPRGPCENAHGDKTSGRKETLAQRLLRERRKRTGRRLAEQAERRRRLLRR